MSVAHWCRLPKRTPVRLRPSRPRRVLRLEVLEDRTAPAVFADFGGLGYLSPSGANNDVTISQTGGTITIQDSSAQLLFQGNAADFSGGIYADNLDKLTVVPQGLTMNIIVNYHFAFFGSLPTTDTELIIDAGNDATSRAVTLSRATLNDFRYDSTQFDGSEAATVFFFNDAVAPRLQSLTIHGGHSTGQGFEPQGGNRLSIFDTPDGILTTVNSGLGSDVVHVVGTTGELALDGQDGRDRVIFGNWDGGGFSVPPTLSSILSNVSVQNANGLTDLIVDDHGSFVPARFTIDADKIRINHGAGPIAITYASADLASLTVRGGPGLDRFRVEDTTAVVPITLDGGPGIDRVRLVNVPGKIEVLDTDGVDAIVEATGAPLFQHVIDHGPSAPGTLNGVVTMTREVHVYRFDVAVAGLLTVDVANAAFDSRIALVNTPSYLINQGLPLGGGGLLAGSDDDPSRGGAPHIEMYVAPGTYYVEVTASPADPGGAGAFELVVALDTVAPNPLQDDGVNEPVLVVVGDNPQEIIAFDFNRDGIRDLATASFGSGEVWVLFGNGDGSFQEPIKTAVPGEVRRLDLVPPEADFNGDFRPDIIVWNGAIAADTPVYVLLGAGDGTFPEILERTLGDFKNFDDSPYTGGVVQVEQVHDFNRDGTQDTIEFAAIDAVNFKDDVLITQGLPSNQLLHLDYPPVTDGTFGPLTFPLGEDAFIQTDRNVTHTARATPLFYDVDGDGSADMFQVTGDGIVKFRHGLGGGTFAAPQDLSAFSPKEIALLAPTTADPVLRLAALSAGSDQVFLFDVVANGAGIDLPLASLKILATGILPVKLATGDLNVDGRNDLVVANAYLGTLSLYLNTATGFERGADMKAGITCTELLVADLNGDARPDIVVTDQLSGDLSVFIHENVDAAVFQDEMRYRAGQPTRGYEVIEGPASVLANEGLPPGTFPLTYFVYSQLNTCTAVVGDFTGDGIADLVVTNQGNTDSDFPEPGHFALLRGKANGTFADPVAAFATGNGPGVAVAGDFNNDGALDLAVLNELDRTVQIFQGDGVGGFVSRFVFSAGSFPTGLTTSDINGDNVLDLVVGNVYGDVLRLIGQGNFFFRPPQAATGNIGLAVANLDNVGGDDIALANRLQDRVAVQATTVTTTYLRNDLLDLINPTEVRFNDLNGDGIEDLVAVNSGGNSIIVGLGTGGGSFGAVQSFFVGTEPTGLTIGDVNGDGRPDLVVANKGSNDVSLLYGSGTGSAWTLIAGPRLQTGGLAPVAAAIQDVDGNGVADLVVTNRQSNDVAVLPGLGNGFFNDVSPVVTAVGPNPASLVAVLTAAGPGFVTLNAGANTFSVLTNFSASGFTVTSTFNTGGTTPVGGVANDFNADGLTDLLIANNSDGQISLFLGSEDGFDLARIFTDARVPNPSALALSALDSSSGFWVTTDGVEQAFFIPFNREQVTESLPLEESELAVVATLVAGGLLGPDQPVQGPLQSAVGFVNRLGPRVGGSLDEQPLESFVLFTAEVFRGWWGAIEPGIAVTWNALADIAEAAVDVLGVLPLETLKPIGEQLAGMPWAEMSSEMVRSLYESGRFAWKTSLAAAATPSDRHDLGDLARRSLAALTAGSQSASWWFEQSGQEISRASEGYRQALGGAFDAGAPALEAIARALRHTFSHVGTAMLEMMPDMVVQPAAPVGVAPAAGEPVSLAAPPAEHRDTEAAILFLAAGLCLPGGRTSRLAERRRPGLTDDR